MNAPRQPIAWFGCLPGAERRLEEWKASLPDLLIESGAFAADIFGNKKGEMAREHDSATMDVYNLASCIGCPPEAALALAKLKAENRTVRGLVLRS